MGDWPQNGLDGPLILHPWLNPEFGVWTNTSLETTASAAWPTANQATFYPFHLSGWVTVVDLFWYVGATSNGNVDVGIYDSQKNLLVSAGTTGMSVTTSTIQVLPCTDTTLGPGDYMMAGVCSSATGTIFGFTAQNDELFMSATAWYTQATAIPLPNPGVPVISTTATGAKYVFGAICRSVF